MFGCRGHQCQVAAIALRVSWLWQGPYLRAVSKAIEKAQVGAVWAERGRGDAVFAMILKQDRGVSMAQQPGPRCPD